MFSCEICQIFKSTFFYRTPPVAASENGVDTWLYWMGSNALSGDFSDNFLLSLSGLQRVKKANFSKD